MGLARIVSHDGQGLYTVRPTYEEGSIRWQLAVLGAAATDYEKILADAYTARDLLLDDLRTARTALNAVIALWRKTLDEKLQTPPPLEPPDPNDPETGEPWTDTQLAQSAAVFPLLNDERELRGVNALTRNGKLDAAAMGHLHYLVGANKTGHTGVSDSQVGDRITWQGYVWSACGENLAYGQDSPDAAVRDWMNSPGHRANLLNSVFTETGLAYLYSEKTTYTHYWCQVFATPADEPPPGSEENQIVKKAQKKEEEIKKIEVPKLDKMTPKQLGEAASKFALAAKKYQLALSEIERIKAEKIARDRKILELQALLTSLGKLLIQVWCADYYTQLQPGNLVPTFEVPGYRGKSYLHTDSEGVTRAEYPVNIAPYTRTPAEWNHDHIGILNPAAGVSKEMTFVNLALEPGHLKWRPAWRYGVIESLTLHAYDLDTQTYSDYATVILETVKSRIEKGAAQHLALHLNQSPVQVLPMVPIKYMTCNGSAFAVGDEVLVLFEGQDRAKPKVVGFRREPKQCISILVAENDWVSPTIGVNKVHRIFSIKKQSNNASIQYINAGTINTSIDGGLIKGLLRTEGDGFIHTDLIGLEQSVHRIDRNGNTLWNTLIPGSDIASIAYDHIGHGLLVSDVDNGKVWILNPDTGAITGGYTPDGITPLNDLPEIWWHCNVLTGVAVDDDGNKIYSYSSFEDPDTIRVGNVVTPTDNYIDPPGSLTGIVWHEGNVWITLSPGGRSTLILRLSADGSSALNIYEAWRYLDGYDFWIGMGCGFVPKIPGQDDPDHPPPDPDGPLIPPGADANGNNPATGRPYTDEERAAALGLTLLELINLERQNA